MLDDARGPDTACPRTPASAPPPWRCAPKAWCSTRSTRPRRWARCPSSRLTDHRCRPDHGVLAHRRAARRRRGVAADDRATQHERDRHGPPVGGPAQELIDCGFALENADAPLLHAGLNLADLAHVLDLHERGIVPRGPAERLVGEVLRGHRGRRPRTSPTTRPTASRTTAGSGYFTARIGDDAGWLHAGRPRREAVRIALRLCTCAPSSPTWSRPPAELAGTMADGRARAQPHLAARPDLPAARPALDVRALPALASPTPCCATPSGCVDALGVDQHQPRRRRLRQRQPAARRPRPGRRAARLRRRHRAHPRRDVADRRPGRRARRRRQPR